MTSGVTNGLAMVRSGEAREVRIDAAIVGVHKCATTSLWKLIAQHPHVKTHFAGQIIGPYVERLDGETVDFVLEDHFPPIAPEDYVLVRDTMLYGDPARVARLAGLFPDLKLIVCVREPVSRAMSAFEYATEKGYETEFRTLEEAFERQQRGELDIRSPPILNYFDQGLYAKHCHRLAERVPSASVLIVDAASLSDDPQGVAASVFRFLGLEAFRITPVTANVRAGARSRAFNRFVQTARWPRLVLRKVLSKRLRVVLMRSVLRLNDRTRRSSSYDHGLEGRLGEFFADDWARVKDRAQLVGARAEASHVSSRVSNSSPESTLGEGMRAR